MWLLQYRFNRWRKRNPELVWRITTALFIMGLFASLVLVPLCVSWLFPYQAYLLP